MKEINKILNYFSAFEEKDYKKASVDFSQDIELKDWNGWWKGDHVEDAIQGIFDSVKSIEIFPLSFYVSSCEGETTVTCKIKIVINRKKSLNVVDIITLKGENIVKIDAYKQ